jgi:acetolactate synthase-1/2/3 large subunit
MPEVPVANVRVADVLIAALARAGVDHVFTLPGGGSMHLVDALAKSADVDAFPCHHEQACGIAAEAYGRVRGPFGVVLVTTGPGATNVLTPLVGAWIESSPMIVLAGQVKRADAMSSADRVRQKGVQEVALVEAVSHWTKWSVTLDDPQDAREVIERAIHEATTGRPGPVWIDVPLDVQAAPVDPARLRGYQPVRAPVVLSAQDVALVADLLTRSERPLILAGHGVRVGGAVTAFRTMVEALGVPVVTTWNASDLLAWDDPLLVGRPGSVAVRAPNFAIQNCDLLIAIGARVDAVVAAYDRGNFARGARRVLVDVDANELTKFDRDGDMTIVASAAAFCDALSSAVSSRPSIDPWRARCADWKRRYGLCDGAMPVDSNAIGHYRFIDALSEAVDENSLIATGSSGLAVGAMGYGLAAAIGACIAADRAPTLCIESDGSMMLNVQELATIAHHALPIRIVLMNNRGYASIRNTQRNYFDGRFVGTDGPSGLGFPDWGMLARAFGIGYACIDDPACDLSATLRDALALPAPCLIDVRLETDATLWPKVAAIPLADGSMVSMPLEDMSPPLPLDVLSREMDGRIVAASVAVRAR